MKNRSASHARMWGGRHLTDRSGRILTVLGFVAVCLLVPSCQRLGYHGPGPNGSFTIREADLPVTALYHLHKGDKVVYRLPNGRRLFWLTESDSGDAGEQVTNSGLKAWLQEPEFDAMKDYGVSSSDATDTSIYSGEIDGYTVERAEDLAATHSLPVIIRVSKAGTMSELSGEEARAQFDARAEPAVGARPRVPIMTVQKELRQMYPFTVGFVTATEQNGRIDLEVDLYREPSQAPGAERDSQLRAILDYVVARWDKVDQADQIALCERDRSPSWNVAKKDASGKWVLQIRP